MANWAGAVETFGKGLFEVGKVVTRREDDEIAFMRQKALQELGIKAQKELQTASQEFTKGENEKNRKHDQTQLTTKAGLDLALQDRGMAHDERLRAQSQSFELSMQSRRESFAKGQEKVKSLDDLKSLMVSQMRSVDSDLRAAEKAALDYRASAQTQGVEIDPTILSQYESVASALRQEKAQMRDSFTAALASYSGITPEPPAKAELGSNERTSAVSRKPTATGRDLAQQDVAPKKVEQIPAGGYQGGQSAAPAASGGSLFELSPEKTPWAFKKTSDINRAIGESLGEAVVDESPTGQINRKIRDSLFGN